jgi:hypothetical protein
MKLIDLWSGSASQDATYVHDQRLANMIAVNMASTTLRLHSRRIDDAIAGTMVVWSVAVVTIVWLVLR